MCRGSLSTCTCRCHRQIGRWAPSLPPPFPSPLARQRPQPRHAIAAGQSTGSICLGRLRAAAASPARRSAPRPSVTACCPRPAGCCLRSCLLLPPAISHQTMMVCKTLRPVMCASSPTCMRGHGTQRLQLAIHVGGRDIRGRHTHWPAARPALLLLALVSYTMHASMQLGAGAQGCHLDKQGQPAPPPSLELHPGSPGRGLKRTPLDLQAELANTLVSTCPPLRILNSVQRFKEEGIGREDMVGHRPPHILCGAIMMCGGQAAHKLDSLWHRELYLPDTLASSTHTCLLALRVL